MKIALLGFLHLFSFCLHLLLYITESIQQKKKRTFQISLAKICSRLSPHPTTSFNRRSSGANLPPDALLGMNKECHHPLEERSIRDNARQIFFHCPDGSRWVTKCKDNQTLDVSPLLLITSKHPSRKHSNVKKLVQKMFCPRKLIICKVSHPCYLSCWGLLALGS